MELPIDEVLPEIGEALKTHSSLILVAPPGAGKTTRVPPFLVASGFTSPQRPEIVMLQPRRIAVRAAARRIAEEQDWRLGDEVGYQIRFENRTSPKTKIRVVTEGILTRQLALNGDLPRVSVVILDEFHERNQHSDITLALLKELQASVRPDLKIIVMSATLEAGPVAKYLGANTPIVVSKGRPYPVEQKYSQHSLFYGAGEPLTKAVVGATKDLINDPQDDRGDILIFLPGTREIRAAHAALESTLPGALILSLYGALNDEAQDLVFQPSQKRKIICSTNIAETSLTIDGVTSVIDSGLSRVNRFRADTGVESLTLGKISRSSADQRSGRAGRQRPGRALRLWSLQEHNSLPESVEPEILRMDLSEILLLLSQWGVRDFAKFDWFERPSGTAIKRAEKLLQDLGALSATGELTESGRIMHSFPVHPRLARILIDARARGLEESAALMCALLSERFQQGLSEAHGSHLRGGEESDILTMMELASKRKIFSVEQAKNQYLKLARELPLKKKISYNSDEILKLLLMGYPDRLCRRRKATDRALMVGGKGVQLARESEVKTSALFISLDPQEGATSSTDLFVRNASRISMEWVEEAFPGQTQEQRKTEWDEKTGKATTWIFESFRGLPLEEPRTAVPSRDDLESFLRTHLFEQRNRLLLPRDEVKSWVTRLNFLKKNLPEEEIPEVDEDFWRAAIDALCMGKTKLSEIEKEDPIPFFEMQLSQQQNRLLKSEAPASINVPTGNSIRLLYEEDGKVKLPVRLQEVFGLLDTPKLAKGKVPVLMELLGPNYRAVQLTYDLRSFWKTGYHEVRKELRLKYPKHSWPENPLEAAPVAKGRPMKR